jgi:hypothetical protein
VRVRRRRSRRLPLLGLGPRARCTGRARHRVAGFHLGADVRAAPVDGRRCPWTPRTSTTGRSCTPARSTLTFSPALIPAHRPSFTNDATTRALSGRVLCSAPTSAAVIPTLAVIIPTVAPIAIDPNPARADFDALGLRGGASNYQRRSRKQGRRRGRCEDDFRHIWLSFVGSSSRPYFKLATGLSFQRPQGAATKRRTSMVTLRRALRRAIEAIGAQPRPHGRSAACSDPVRRPKFPKEEKHVPILVGFSHFPVRVAHARARAGKARRPPFAPAPGLAGHFPGTRRRAAAVGVARDLLAHSDLCTTIKHYNRARGIEASRAHCQVIAELRRKLNRRS